MAGKVFLVGAGPGDPGLLTIKGKRAIESADVLVYDYLAAEPIVALAPPDCERIYVGKKARAHTFEQEEINTLLIRLAREGKNVVRLKGGDPLVFGRGGEEAQELHAAGIAFEIVPGVTSGIAAAAYAGIPVTHRDHNTAVTFVTGHEDAVKQLSTLDWSKLAAPNHTLVLYMAMGNLASIAAELVRNGLNPSTPIAIVREGTKPSQQTLVATLGTIASEIEHVPIAPPAIAIVGEVVRLRDELRWFDQLPLFGKRVLVTRMASGSLEFAARLWEAGGEPILAPLIRIVPPEDTREIIRAVESATSYKWIVFSSRNGVDAFWGELQARGRDARAFATTKVAAIGPKTAETLSEHGIMADFIPSRYVGESVGEGLLARTEPNDRILLFRAQEARDALPDMLRDAGRNVEIVAAYRAVRNDVADLAERVAKSDVLTFTSAGIVRSFVAQLPDPIQAARGKIVACIGPITADAAKAAGLDVSVVAEEFTTEGLARALIAAPILR
ncbi:MAG TPA: uroporphyrinogen-III C-methyltransferase [Candidatus Baltobacteraceae bacterium]|jgi:uroporphyrinogen III methyltransferase/synthase